MYKSWTPRWAFCHSSCVFSTLSFHILHFGLTLHLISSEKSSHDNISANCEQWDTKSAKLCGHYRGPWDILHGWHNLERGGVNVDNLFVLANTRSTARLPVWWFAWIHWFLPSTDPCRLLQTVKLTTSEQTNIYLFSGITPSNIIQSVFLMKRQTWNCERSSVSHLSNSRRQ